VNHANNKKKCKSQQEQQQQQQQGEGGETRIKNNNKLNKTVFVENSVLVTS